LIDVENERSADANVNIAYNLYNTSSVDLSNALSALSYHASRYVLASS